MRDPVRFVLSLMVIEADEPDRNPHISSSVQVWQGKEHVTTVDLANNYFEWPESGDRDTVEGYAAVAARVAARHISAVQMRAVEDDAVNLRDKFGQESAGA